MSMENLALVSSSNVLPASCTNLSGLISIRRSFHPLPHLSPSRRYGATRTRALAQRNSERARPFRKISLNLMEKSGLVAFASISSSSGNETSSISVNPPISMPPPPSHVGSPLFWIGVGVGLSALFSWVATNLKKYAMQQALKTMMGQMSSENNKFNNPAFSPGSPFPFPVSGTSFPASGTSSPVVSPSPFASQTTVTVDVPVSKVEATPATEIKDNTEIKEPKRYAFVDVSPEEMVEKDHFEESKESVETSSSKDVQITEEVYQNGAASKQNAVHDEQFQSTQKAGSVLSVEALEKMMEDPMVQQMVYPTGLHVRGSVDDSLICIVGPLFDSYNFWVKWFLTHSHFCYT